MAARPQAGSPILTRVTVSPSSGVNAAQHHPALALDRFDIGRRTLVVQQLKLTEGVCTLFM